MEDLFATSMITVGAGRTSSGIANRRQTLQIVSGSVWITVENEPFDYWLSTGDVLEVAPDRRIVVEADREDCCVATNTPAHHSILDAVSELSAGAWRRLRHVFTDRISGGAAEPVAIGSPCGCTN